MPRRQKGDTSVATQSEVKDLRKEVEGVAAGTRKVKAGYEDQKSSLRHLLGFHRTQSLGLHPFFDTSLAN